MVDVSSRKLSTGILREDVLRLSRIALSEIVDDHVMIGCAPRGVGTNRRPLHRRKIWIEFLHPFERERDAFNLESEVVQPATPAIAKRDVVEADLTIADRRRTSGALCVRGLHSEERLIEPGVGG